MTAFKDEWPCLIIVPSSLRGTNTCQHSCSNPFAQLLSPPRHHIFHLHFCIMHSVRHLPCPGYNRQQHETVFTLLVIKSSDACDNWIWLSAEQWADALVEWVGITEDQIHVTNSGRDTDLTGRSFKVRLQ